MSHSTAPARVGPPPPPVCVVVLNWNQPALTLRCVRHVLAQDYLNRRVVVVDNGSNQACQQQLAQQCLPSVELIQLADNLGFAGAMNEGIRHALAAGAEYVWLLNNDAFPAATCLSRLVEAVSVGDDIAAATPALYSPDGTEQFCWVVINWRSLTMETFLSGSPPGNQFGTWLRGTALLFRAESLRRIGPLDVRFFAYMEEVEWFMRSHRAGYRVVVAPEGRCVHLVSASTGGKNSPMSLYLMTRNAWLFFQQYPARKEWLSRLMALVANNLMDMYADANQGRTAQAQARLSGIAAALLRETGKPKRLTTESWVMRSLIEIVKRSPFRCLRWLQSISRW